MWEIVQRTFGVGVIVCGILCAAWGTPAKEPPSRMPQTSWSAVAKAPGSPAKGGVPATGRIQVRDAGDVQINWSQLGLSEAQKQEMVAKRREFQVTTAGIREELKFFEQDLRTEMAKDPADRAAIDVLLGNIASAKGQLSEAAVQNILDLKGLLTPDQIDKLAESQMKLPRDLQALQLTDEQRKEVSQTFRIALQANHQATNQLQILRIELQDLLLLADPPDKTRISEVQRAISEQEMVMEKGRVELFLRMREILTPKQFKSYQKSRERRKPEKEQPLQPEQPKRR